MDFYFKEDDYYQTFSTVCDNDLIESIVDRVTLINLCNNVIKSDEDPYSQKFRELLLAEISDKLSLQYLIDNPKQSAKIYLGWFSLICFTVLRPVRNEYLKQQDSKLIAVHMSQFTDDQLINDWHKLPNTAQKYFKFATAKEVKKFDKLLDVNQTYIKVHFTINIKRLSVQGLLHKGYFFIEFESNIREIFTFRIEEEWNAIWHKHFELRLDIFNMYNRSGLVEKIEASLDEHSIKRKRVEENSTLPIILQGIPHDYFPPCMATMYSCLNINSSIKYAARLQLVLFLYDIGVSSNNIVQLFESNYCKTAASRLKLKEVLYYIRHLIALTPTRRSYKSYNCQQVQDFPTKDGTEHGCYFQIVSERQMNLDMQKLDFQSNAMQAIFSKLKDKGPTAACQLHLQTKCKIDKVPYDMVKPNDYFQMAQCPVKFDATDIEDILSWKDVVSFDFVADEPTAHAQSSPNCSQVDFDYIMNWQDIDSFDQSNETD